jgi:sporulation protein YlmC with PRC-barrel domain
MALEQRDSYGMYVRHPGHKGPGPELMGANTLIGEHVHNRQHEHLGQIKDIVLDMRDGTIAYAVLARGGVLSVGEQLYAVPWSALRVDGTRGKVTLDVTAQHMARAPGFEPDCWPDLADPHWQAATRAFYEQEGLADPVLDSNLFGDPKDAGLFS